MIRLSDSIYTLVIMLGIGSSCGVENGSNTRLSASDYDQSCLDITQCILVDLDVCNPCQCPDSVIAEAAYDSFNDDSFQIQQTYCPEDSEPVSCPNCNLREPVCRDESCLIK